jgi:hypothetical protein
VNVLYSEIIKVTKQVNIIELETLDRFMMRISNGQLDFDTVSIPSTLGFRGKSFAAGDHLADEPPDGS